MLDPNEDTEWNDVLRAKGIIPPKEKGITEEQIIQMMEDTIAQREKTKEKEMSELDLDGLDELEDSEDEAVLEEYRRKRIAEMRAMAEQAKFGFVIEISGENYVQEVTNAGSGIWVVLHLYAPGIPQCALINQFMNELAMKYPTTKFVKSIAATCLPNFPEKNLPTVFVYYEKDLKRQMIGPVELRGEKLTVDEFEYLLGQCDAVPTDIKEDPRPSVKDKMMADLADTNDW